MCIFWARNCNYKQIRVLEEKYIIILQQYNVTGSCLTRSTGLQAVQQQANKIIQAVGTEIGNAFQMKDSATREPTYY